MLIQACLSKLGFEAVCTVCFGAPKNAVREPCLSFLGSGGDEKADEMVEVAFLFTFIVLLAWGNCHEWKIGAWVVVMVKWTRLPKLIDTKVIAS